MHEQVNGIQHLLSIQEIECFASITTLLKKPKMSPLDVMVVIFMDILQVLLKLNIICDRLLRGK